jgi:hypothetical protein
MVDPRWTDAPPAKAPGSPPAEAARHAVASATSRPADGPVHPAFADCRLCHGTGTMTWTQMCPDGVLRELSHPCVEDGHATGWHRSVDAEHRVVNATTTAERRSP